MPWSLVCCRRRPPPARTPAQLGPCVTATPSLCRTPLGWLTLPCSCRRRKEKAAEEDEEVGVDTEGGLELGERTPGKVLTLRDGLSSQGFSLANGQDADELGADGGAIASASDVPAWQMPKLVVECSRRPSARVHKGTSLILPDAGGDLMAGIVANLPVLLQIRPCWQLGYSMAIDGVSLRTMYRQMEEVGPCVLIVEDSNACIFGAFMSEGLRPANQCCGTHECFIFRYPRAAGAWRTEVFRQAAPPPQAVPSVATEDAGDEACASQGSGAERTKHFEALKKCQAWAVAASPACGAVFCDHTGIVVGIDGPGIFIDQDLLRGVSWPSKAFGSPCLAAAGADFVVRNLEVWHWAS